MNKRENQEEEKNILNKSQSDSDLNINKGFELLLRNRRKSVTPKTLEFRFGKMLSFFNKEIHFSFDISFDIKKK
tara:strand:+ start:2609 stop:2830 length:222 start_codon:yes stop_codon:yes gene_type:complete